MPMPDFTDGQILTAALLNELADAIDELVTGNEDFGTYSGTWPGSSTATHTGSITFSKTFASPPTLTGTVRIGANRDVGLNWQSVTTTGATWRLFQVQGTPFASSSFDINWVAKGALA